ncbi:hypothetical protein RHSIM_Rhsim08G0102700 [Rhododendron simsii]|uniref:Endonuclease/exonuclease/phosphatase domain-containing protein n=1 Tax=Rhododendron simsii TaxID=118357 RepID=A0A834LF89_RHOSS|nr:hypothetical protein RHSIM_Rhsim08G0102700 [Rhododendron simsii]
MGEGENGEEMRRNAKKWKDLAEEATKEGGSSYVNLRDLGILWMRFKTSRRQGSNNPIKQVEIRKFIHAYSLSLIVVMHQKTFIVSYIYGFNQASDRRKLWDELRMGLGLVGNQPWIILGDFNAVRWQQAKSDPTSFDSASAGELNSCLEDIGVEELNSTGPWFTWSNKRLGNDHCSSRIDTALVNSQWQFDFSESAATVLVPGISDHCPIQISILPCRGGRKPFKFFNFWMNHQKFPSLLSQSWSDPLKCDCPMLLLYNKLRRLKPVLRKFNKEFYSDIQKRVLEARLELTDIHNRCASSPSDPILLDALHSSLCAPVTPAEIRTAIFAINGDKAPGPGGFNASFFHKNWSLVSTEKDSGVAKCAIKIDLML